MSKVRNLFNCDSQAHCGNLLVASSQLLVLVSFIKDFLSTYILFKFSASLFISLRERCPLTHFSSSMHWSLDSKQRIGARYCCLKSGLVLAVADLSFWSFSLAFSNRSMTLTAKSHTCFGKDDWKKIESRWVVEMSCNKSDLSSHSTLTH